MSPNNKAFLMMQKMGYKEGVGLGKNEQGIISPIKVLAQEGTVGLGFELKSDIYTPEEVSLKETITWLENKSTIEISDLKPQMKIVNSEDIPVFEKSICDPELYDEIVKAKELFNHFDIAKINKARGRANPFETIYSVFFMNRAALKLANIDAACDFMFTDIKKYFECEENGPFYFADICAGPGGFSEYLLWRNSWFFKGFGFTLKNENDFKLNNSACIYPNSFDCYYGKEGDGNICNPSNINDFKDKVLYQTEFQGVHLVTADGGFSVDGNEDLQEVLSKNIYLCQCLTALEILRNDGNFVVKLFDTFTRFSIGLIYLMYNCFEKVTIIKPNASRPANSERYLICCKLQNVNLLKIKNYLRYVCKKLWELKDDNRSVSELISFEIMEQDESFFKFIKSSISNIGNYQVNALKKLQLFCEHSFLCDKRQDDFRTKSLKYWNIPDQLKKKNKISSNASQYIESRISQCWLWAFPKEIDINEAKDILEKTKDILIFPMFSSSLKFEKSCFGLFVGLGGKSCFWSTNSWVVVKNLQLSYGTILYGEMVKEEIEYINKDKIIQTLHVFDALYLGNVNLMSYDYNRRMSLIQVYCKSLTHIFKPKHVQLRKKDCLLLADIKSIMSNQIGDYFYSYISMPKLQFESKRETHKVNSLLLVEPYSQLDYTSFCLHRQVDLQNRDDLHVIQRLVDKKLPNS